LNIVIIPSWYRSSESPDHGVFIREQVVALARHFPVDRFFVSLPAQNQWQISLRQPQKALTLAWRYLSGSRNTPVIYSDPAGYIEVLTPCLTWSERLLLGNLRGLLAAHRQNLNYIEAHFGKLDILHAHVTWPAGEIGRQLAVEKNIPLLITEHMGPFPFPNKLFLTASGQLTPLLKRPLAAAQSVIAVSASLAHRMMALGVRHVEVIPNCVDEFLFTPSSVSGSEFIFICVARLCLEKGIDDLLAAFAVVSSQFSVRLQLIGPGDIAYYQQQARMLGIEKQVEILGAVPHQEIAAYLQQAHVFVLPSHGETFGVSYVEALACGKPVIATRCGGPEDFISVTNGLLIPVGDRDALVSAMQYFVQKCTDYDAAQISAACLSRFASGPVAQRLMQKYLELRGGGKTA
jgi:glycosyltransferase involved in cell wall biosynthesis